jgi:hypothetical protein
VPVAVPRRTVPVLALIGVLIVGADAAYAAATTVGHLGVVAVLGVAAAVLGVVAMTAA